MPRSRKHQHPRPKTKRSRKGRGRPAAPPGRPASQRTNAPSPRHHPVRAFLSQRQPKDPEAAHAALRAMLSLGWGEAKLLAGGWVGFGLVELYVAAIPGYGPGRGTRLVARFLRFLEAEGLLHPWDHARLAWEVDEARLAHGLNPLGAVPAWDWARPEAELPELLAAFFAADTELTPFQRHVADPCLRYFATFGLGVAGPVCFGAVEPATMLERLSLAQNPPGSERNLFLISAVFTRWLGGAGILEPGRARGLADELMQLATAFAHPTARA